jgi:hypothetical protein
MFTMSQPSQQNKCPFDFIEHMKFPKARVFSPLQNLTRSWHKNEYGCDAEAWAIPFQNKNKNRNSNFSTPLFLSKLGTHI